MIQSAGHYRRHHDAGGVPGQPAGRQRRVFHLRLCQRVGAVVFGHLYRHLPVQRRFNNRILNIINKVCGAVIIFYGCKLAWSFLKLMGWVG